VFLIDEWLRQSYTWSPDLHYMREK
jgi:hypothetical protein